jgi:hypothetical protein
VEHVAWIPAQGRDDSLFGLSKCHSALGLKGYTKGLIDIQTAEIWFEAKDTARNSSYAMFTQLLHYVQVALIGREIMGVPEEDYALLFFADIMHDGTVSSHQARTRGRPFSAHPGECNKYPDPTGGPWRSTGDQPSARGLLGAAPQRGTSGRPG